MGSTNGECIFKICKQSEILNEFSLWLLMITLWFSVVPFLPALLCRPCVAKALAEAQASAAACGSTSYAKAIRSGQREKMVNQFIDY